MNQNKHFDWRTTWSCRFIFFAHPSAPTLGRSLLKVFAHIETCSFMQLHNTILLFWGLLCLGQHEGLSYVKTNYQLGGIKCLSNCSWEHRVQLGTEFMSDEKSLWFLERILLCSNAPQYAKVKVVHIQTGKNTQRAPDLCFLLVSCKKSSSTSFTASK